MTGTAFRIAKRWSQGGTWRRNLAYADVLASTPADALKAAIDGHVSNWIHVDTLPPDGTGAYEFHECVCAISRAASRHAAEPAGPGAAPAYANTRMAAELREIRPETIKP